MDQAIAFLSSAASKLAENYIITALFILITPLLAVIKSKKLLNRLKNAAVKFIYTNRDSYTKDRKKSFEKYIESAEISFLYFGHWLAVSLDQKNTLNSLEKILNSERKATIIMIKKDLDESLINYYSELYNEDPENLKRNIKQNWNDVLNWRDSLSTIQQSNLSLREHTKKVSFSAFSFDRESPKNHILIDQKIWGLKRRDSFGIELCKKMSKGKERTLYCRYAECLLNLERTSTEYTES